MDDILCRRVKDPADLLSLRPIQRHASQSRRPLNVAPRPVQHAGLVVLLSGGLCAKDLAAIPAAFPGRAWVRLVAAAEEKRRSLSLVVDSGRGLCGDVHDQPYQYRDPPLSPCLPVSVHHGRRPARSIVARPTGTPTDNRAGGGGIWLDD